MLWRVPFVILCSLCMLIMINCKSLTDIPETSFHRERRDANDLESRQAILGPFGALGALIQPILFMIGVANFMGRMPQYFTRMRDRIGLSLGGMGHTAGAGRKKRSTSEDVTRELTEDEIEILRYFSDALKKFEGDHR